MSTALRYSFDNIDNYIYTYRIRLKSKASFILCGCKVQFINGETKHIIIESLESDEDLNKLYLRQENTENCAKLLSYIFTVPIYDRRHYDVVNTNVDVNNAISKKNLAKIQYIDKCVSKFNKTKDFFYEILDLYVIALENLLDCRNEDAFLYYFKIVEKISKNYYLSYMQRYNKKNNNKDNKKELKEFIQKYATDRLGVTITEDMLNTKVDLLYKNLKMEFYGSVFNKISLVITKEKIPTDLEGLSKLVKTRNKLAHGDSIPFSEMDLPGVIVLANEMISKRFFRKKFSDLNLKSIELVPDV